MNSKYIRVDIAGKDTDGTPLYKIDFGGDLTGYNIIDLMTNMVINMSTDVMKAKPSGVIDLMGEMIRDWEKRNGMSNNKK